MAEKALSVSLRKIIYTDWYRMIERLVLKGLNWSELKEKYNDQRQKK